MVGVTIPRPTVELDESNVADYLRGRGVVPPGDEVVVLRLSGGYVNNVFRAESGGRAWVLKQSLDAAQRTVLTAGIGRALAEVAAMKAIKALLGPLAPIPIILDDDPANYVSVMTPAPDDARLYDTELLDGRFHPGTGRALGTYAGHLHARTEGRADLACAFADNPGFALRDQSIRSAGPANPDLAPLIDDALRRNRDESRVLVDADITPKNVLVHRAEAARPGACAGITKLDFECTQWGHPALDVGIIVAHFILLGFARPPWHEPLLAEARACYEAYAALRPEARSPAFTADVALFAAVMMLGRADGALVFDYLIPCRLRLRTLAADLCAGVRTPADLITRAGATLAELAV
jgi:aminoglycoside phosphotransferase (APT) family kinase protein